MIGIYKITNKNNNKSYIGQSIHCGKRLDEHSKGGQFIDEIIQLEGIENFDFNILKEVDKKELSYWEDYYIIKYNTLFPNGYNKKMNTNKDTQKEIKKLLEEETLKEVEKKSSVYLKVLANDSHNEINYSKITDKYWSVYYYLVSISLWDMASKEDHRYVDKKNINISNVSKMLNISRPTFIKQ